jgi:hypothetical protein
MSSQSSDNSAHEGFRLTLDGWAVLVALLLAAAVRFHILKVVPW